MLVVSKYSPLERYQWGAQCDGWNLVVNDTLVIKHERMPAGTSEVMHYHQCAQQFFFILAGTATLIIEETQVIIHEGEGAHVPTGSKHKISNLTAESLEFILCSQPSTVNDRINCHD